MRTFTRHADGRQRFWSVGLSEDGFLTVVEGDVGAEGRRRTRAFASPDAARQELDRLLREKLAEGYREVGGPPVESPLREALEAALVADLDDLTAHMAYADFLLEQGDPDSVARSEFIRAQLALEDPRFSEEELRRRLREGYRPLEVHLRAWLGELAPFLLDAEMDSEPRLQYGFRRGWLDWVAAAYFGASFTRALARSPAARLLRHLSLLDPLIETGSELMPPNAPPGCDCPALYWLATAENLTNVRSLSLGSHGPPMPTALMGAFPRLEKLHLQAEGADLGPLLGQPLPCLRALHVDYWGEWTFSGLADNPTLGQLAELVLDSSGAQGPPDPILSREQLRAVTRSPHLTGLRRLTVRGTLLGDEGVREIVRSGLLDRLDYLSLQDGTVGDAGAQLLAGRRHVRDMERIDLDGNCLTAEGVRVLQEAGARLSAEGQRRRRGYLFDDWESMHEGDLE